VLYLPTTFTLKFIETPYTLAAALQLGVTSLSVFESAVYEKKVRQVSAASIYLGSHTSVRENQPCFAQLLTKCKGIL